MNLRQLSQRVSVYMFTTLISRGVGFILLPFYTKHLNTAEYGGLAIIDTLGLYFSIFIAGGLATALIKYFEADDEHTSNRVFTGIIQIIFLLFITLFVLASGVLSTIQLSELSSSLVLVALIFFGLDTINTIYTKHLAIRKQDKQFFFISMLKLAVAIPLNIYLIAYAQLGIAGFIYANIASSLAITLFFFLPYFIRRYVKNSSEQLKALIKFSYPFIPNGLLEALFTSLSIILLAYFHDQDAVGLFSITVKLASILLLTSEPIQNIWMPYMFSLKNDEHKGIKIAQGMKLLCLTLITVSFCLTAGSGILFFLLVDQAYYSAISALPFLLLANAIYMLRGTARIGLVLTNKVGRLPMATLIAILVSLPFYAYLVYQYSVIGAALGQMLLSTILVVILVYWSKQQCHFPVSIWPYLQMLIVYLVLALSIPISIGLNLFTPTLMVLCFVALMYLSPVLDVSEKKNVNQLIKQHIPFFK